MQNTIHRTRLPAGFRDHGPETTGRLQAYWKRLDALFSRRGFSRVITATVENFDVLRPGMGERSLENTFRLIDPVSGEILAFRPDFTPQIARLFASGVLGRKLPIRVCYRGTVLRRQGAGTSSAREIHQVGIEMIGGTPSQADVEILSLAHQSLAASARPCVVDIGHAGIVSKLLDSAGVAGADREQVVEWISRKETFEIERWAGGSKVRQRLAELTTAFGTWPEVEKVARQWGASVRPELRALAVLDRALEKVRVRRSFDLGFVDGFDYYTGILFAGYVEGSPAAALKGGRYDGLCGRYGRAAPAVGFALDSEAVALVGAPAKALRRRS